MDKKKKRNIIIVVVVMAVALLLYLTKDTATKVYHSMFDTFSIKTIDEATMEIGQTGWRSFPYHRFSGFLEINPHLMMIVKHTQAVWKTKYNC